MDDILYGSIAQIAAQIRKGEISPVELIEATLEAIDRCEPQLNAFITLFREESLKRAREAEVEIRSGKRSRSAARNTDRSQGYNLR